MNDPFTYNHLKFLLMNKDHDGYEEATTPDSTLPFNDKDTEINLIQLGLTYIPAINKALNRNYIGFLINRKNETTSKVYILPQFRQ